MISRQNILASATDKFPDELVEMLVQSPAVRIERIVSTGQASPEGYWYDQDESEWVLVIQGEAELRFEDLPQPVVMKAGDYVNIPAHCKHRVQRTTADQPTVWLAVFYSANE